jgi:hypothetical protein
LYQALTTWDMIGYIDVTPVSLKFWKQFDERVSVMRYKKDSPGYKVLTEYVRGWANKIVLQLAKATPPDYVLVECVDKVTGGPYGPRGMIRSLAAALGVIDAWKGIKPPNWGHVLGASVHEHERPPAQPQWVVQTEPRYRQSPDVCQQESFDSQSFRYRYVGY